MNRFGVREICDVVFKPLTSVDLGGQHFDAGQPMLYIDTAKTSSLEGAATTVYAQGGKGRQIALVKFLELLGTLFMRQSASKLKGSTTNSFECTSQQFLGMEVRKSKDKIQSNLYSNIQLCKQ